MIYIKIRKEEMSGLYVLLLLFAFSHCRCELNHVCFAYANSYVIE